QPGGVAGVWIARGDGNLEYRRVARTHERRLSRRARRKSRSCGGVRLGGVGTYPRDDDARAGVVWRFDGADRVGCAVPRCTPRRLAGHPTAPGPADRSVLLTAAWHLAARALLRSRRRRLP